MALLKIISSYLSLHHTKSILSREFCSDKVHKPPWKVLFFGSDDFSLFSLNSLTEEYRKGDLISKLEVVTSSKNKPNIVNIFSEKNNLIVRKYPPKLSKYEFDVGLVVSFGHLIPKHIIDCFRYGMLNVHASLLPRWRGAAPIIYAIANGDTETGVTIMKLNPYKFDIGEILLQESVSITPHMKMGDLRTVLGKLGAKNLIKTLQSLETLLRSAKPQPSVGATYGTHITTNSIKKTIASLSFCTMNHKTAPKVNAHLSVINWRTMSSTQVYNLARALEEIFPLQSTWKGISIKLFNIELAEGLSSDSAKLLKPGYVEFDKEKQLLKIFCNDNKFVSVGKLGVVGKRIMSSRDFNNGYLKKEPPHSRCFQ